MSAGLTTDLTAVSLFAGIGGFDRALELAGVRTVAAVEIDPDCRGVLRRHFPQAAVFDDVTEVTGDHLRAAGFVPGRGVLCAGWPCQGNSVAGRRKGMADPRSGLWRHVVRLLDEARPRWFIGENVPGLLSINGGRDFGAVLGDLDDLGYGVAWRVLDAQFFGVPQRRRRVFLAGCLGDPCGPVEVLFEPEGGAGDLAEGRAEGPGTADTPPVGAVATLQGGGRRGHRVDAEGAAGGHLVTAYTVHAAESTAKERHAFKTETARCLDTTGGFASNQGGTLISQPVIADTLRSHPRPGSNSFGAVTPDGPMAFNPQTGGSKARIGYGDKPTALQANQVTAVQTSAMVRRLTPVECERLQGFPDDWTRWLDDGTGQSDSARYRQCGNAVAVPVVEWVARRLVAVEGAAEAEAAA